MKISPIWYLIPLVASIPGTIKQINEEAEKPLPDATSDLVPKSNEIIALKSSDLADESESSPVPVEKVELPKHLGVDDFDISTGEKLSLVEFYSPYCHHCKEFAPEWNKAYQEFHLELDRLNIQMRQVNCIESGDLCEREQIFTYPNLRIYSPENGKAKHVDTFPRTLLRTADNVKKYLKNAVAEFDSGTINLPSASQLLNTDQILKIIAGDIKEAHFVTFYPATDSQYKQSDATGKSYFDAACPECNDYKQVWGKLLNQILSTMKTGHLNCHDNPSVCKELGFKALAVPGNRFVAPKFAVFLPKTVGLIRVDYKGLVTLEKMKEFANRLYENYQYEKLSASGVLDVMDYRKELPSKPLDLYYPLPNKISVLFFYDANYVTEEDKAILPYLLEYVTSSPFNMHLYTAKHDRIQDNIEEQEQNLLEFINYNTDVPKKEFDKAMFLASTLTTRPTLFILRDNALYTSVYQSFAPEDMRDYAKIKKFLDKNTYPVYQELTPALLPLYFSKKRETTEDKVVVTFIDSTDALYASNALYNISLAAHEYSYLKKEYYFGKILQDRDAKDVKVAKLKAKDADSVAIIEAMREKVPHFFERADVLFTFFDLSKKEDFAKVRGWHFDPKNFKRGDTVVISKDNRYYWDKQINGQKLVNEPSVLKPVLLSLLDPLLADGKILSKNLVGSPYGGIFGFMDCVHDYGFKGYILLVSLIYVVAKYGRRYGYRRILRRESANVGILGVPKKD